MAAVLTSATVCGASESGPFRGLGARVMRARPWPLQMRRQPEVSPEAESEVEELTEDASRHLAVRRAVFRCIVGCSRVARNTLMFRFPVGLLLGAYVFRRVCYHLRGSTPRLESTDTLFAPYRYARDRSWMSSSKAVRFRRRTISMTCRLTSSTKIRPLGRKLYKSSFKEFISRRD